MTPIDNEPRFTRRPWRALFGLLAALVGSYWVGRQLGLGNDELVGYLLASVSIVIAAATGRAAAVRRDPAVPPLGNAAEEAVESRRVVVFVVQ